MKARSTTTAAFAPAYFSELARVEDRHFWFRSRNRLIKAFVRQLAPELTRGRLILEAGCGNGNVLRHLSQVCSEGLTIGMDFFAEGLRLARARTSCPLVQGDVRHAPFGRRFHLIAMFDVLEHLPDDTQTLRDVRALLEPGGALLLTIPARHELWSYFDQASQHFRRYDLLGLDKKLREAGFRVQCISYFMFSIYPLLWIARRLRGRSETAQGDPALLAQSEFRIVPGLNEILAAILSLEALWVSRGHSLPIGASLVALARKPA